MCVCVCTYVFVCACVGGCRVEWGLTSIVCETFNLKDLVFFTSSNFTKLIGDIVLVVYVVNQFTRLDTLPLII